MPGKKPTRSNRTSKKNKNSGSTRKRKQSAKKSTPNSKSKSSKDPKQPRMEQIEKMWNNIFKPSSEPALEIQETGHAANGNKKAVIVLIHADWCGHCRRLEPEWNTMKSSLDNNVKQNIIFEEIESAELDQKLPLVSKTYLGGKPLEYRGFPTIGSIRNGKFEMYGGGRTAPELLGWIRSLFA
jgi:thiol-disulfide isomerase/thioredoxin